MKFYKIEDQIVISDKSLPVGTELIANTTDASNEKHVPVITIVLVTEAGFQIHYLKPGQTPRATFRVTEPVVAAYEYCNLHGLWMAERN